MIANALIKIRYSFEYEIISRGFNDIDQITYAFWNISFHRQKTESIVPTRSIEESAKCLSIMMRCAMFWVSCCDNIYLAVRDLKNKVLGVLFLSIHISFFDFIVGYGKSFCNTMYSYV